MALKIGIPAPNFALPSTNGSNFILSKEWAGKPGIIYFYPKDFTGGCTKEACDFRDQFSEFRNLELDIVGISMDDIPSHIRFKAQHQLPFELLADTDGKTAKVYDAKVPFVNMAKRITYFLDNKHIIRAVYEDFFAGDKHVTAILEKLKQGKWA
ncbi:MAG: peroxiredoxin [Cytophagales bacterium]|nr:peroxiredoxin [Cytophagales bacterium]